MSLRVALVHDWLTGFRGGEAVLADLIEVFPEGDLFTLIAVPGSVPPEIERNLRGTSFLQWIPGARTRWRALFPLYPAAAEWLDLSDYDLVLSSSHAAAHGVRKAHRAVHLCYCHSPARWAFDLFDEYFPAERFGALRPVVASLMRRYREWDRDAASPARIDAIAANSRAIADRIGRCWGRTAEVVHPPADLDFFRPDPAIPKVPGLAVTVSALVPYKRVDLALEAFRSRPNDRLVVVGSGPEKERLERMRAPNVEFRGSVGREDLRALYRQASTFLLPWEEDFGIATVEAIGCGTPAVALRRGGALDVVREGENGVLFDDPTPESLSSAIDRAADAPFNAEALRRSVETFGRQRFRTEIRAFVERHLPAADRNRLSGGRSELPS